MSTSGGKRRPGRGSISGKGMLFLCFASSRRTYGTTKQSVSEVGHKNYTHLVVHSESFEKYVHSLRDCAHTQADFHEASNLSSSSYATSIKVGCLYRPDKVG